MYSQITNSQRALWNEQHERRAHEHDALAHKPNEFAKSCVAHIPQGGVVLEVGSGNGRDARYFAREKEIHVICAEISDVAVKQLTDAALRDNVSTLIHPLCYDARQLTTDLLKQSLLEIQISIINGVYARSALHLSDEELLQFLACVNPLMTRGALLMIEGKSENDPKLRRSIPVQGATNLYTDPFENGHVRRLWTQQSIEKIVSAINYELVGINQTKEVWHNVETNFINFIARKI
jgi:cyclopropane fatty-acyl-phospholipid synthase-like methyltransferase